MELKWLKDLLALDSTGNFRLAAERRCVSQPAFSRRIQALEAWAGAALIDRSVQPSQLTEAGRLFLPVAQEVVDLAVSGLKDIQTLAFEDKMRMRFSTLSTLAQIFMPSWLKSLQPLIDANMFVVKTEYITTEDHFAALEGNDVDFFVSYEDPHIGFQGDATLFASIKLGEESLVPVAGPDGQGNPRWWLPDKPEGPVPCLHTLSRHSPWPIRRHMENRYGDLTFKSVYQTSLATTLKAMAIEGFGLAWMPSAFVADDLANGRLVRAAEPVDDIAVDIRIYRCSKHNEHRVDKFWQVLLAQEARLSDFTDNHSV
ncbi:MAG: LysR family transcriptional regulator [Alphaproteobacteria bacterium]|nr:LysR family transcriptional regulator [Alphaproteobacteria bacterium]